MKIIRLDSEFEKNKDLIVKAVQLNPREVKRFINNIILAKAVFGKPINELIVVQALNFRRDWNKFLELITPDETRKAFLIEYKKLKEQDVAISDEKHLVEIFNEEALKNNPALKYAIEIYRELLKQDANALRSFLDAGAAEILTGIEKMEEHRRALDTIKHEHAEEKTVAKEQSELIKLLFLGKINEFNKIRAESSTDSRLDLSHVNLSGANLSSAYLSGANLYRANLSGAILSDANLSDANLSDANLSEAKLYRANLYRANLSGAILSDAILPGANLSRTNLYRAILTNTNLSSAYLSDANLSDANLSDANLSDAKLNSSIIIGLRKYDNLKCSNTDFTGAVIDDEGLVDYLNRNMANNVPSSAKNKNELEKKLEKLEFDRETIVELLTISSMKT